MMTDQTIAEQTAPSILQNLCPTGVRVSQVSLEITEAATDESIATLDRMLDEVGDSHQYMLGDYINYLARVQGDAAARKRIAQYRSPETARRAAWVCRKVAAQRRLLSPSYGHSSEVAALDPTEQELWLTKAREQTLSQKALRTQMRQREVAGASATDAATTANQAPVDQAAARAFQDYQSFAAWFAKHRPEFGAAQEKEWDALLLPLVTDFVARMDADAFERLYEARLVYLGKA